MVKCPALFLNTVSEASAELSEILCQSKHEASSDAHTLMPHVQHPEFWYEHSVSKAVFIIFADYASFWGWFVS